MALNNMLKCANLIFCIGGAMCVPSVTTEEQKQALIERVKKHADEIIECIKSL